MSNQIIYSFRFDIMWKMWYNLIMKLIEIKRKEGRLVTVKDIDNRLRDDHFVAYAREFRKHNTVSLKTPEKTRDTFIRLLLLETTAGVNFTDEELMGIYIEIIHLVDQKTTISSAELPYHRDKKRPVQERKFILDEVNCRCTVQ